MHLLRREPQAWHLEELCAEAFEYQLHVDLALRSTTTEGSPLYARRRHETRGKIDRGPQFAAGRQWQTIS
jgi:hypothetical protein